MNQNTSLAPLSTKEEDALRRRFDLVLARLSRSLARAGRQEQDLTLVAVSKWHGLQKILCLARYWQSLGGTPICAENYVQEALAKQEALAGQRDEYADVQLTWHFTGHLQSNKARHIARRFELIHTLDSLALAQNLQRIEEKEAPPISAQAVLVQVNLGLEAGKSGLIPGETEEFINKLRVFPQLEVQGLMCLPPVGEKPEDSRVYFIQLRQMRDSLEQKLGIKLPQLSMGMSQDFEVAVEEGATLIRVGTDIFGQRE